MNILSNLKAQLALVFSVKMKLHLYLLWSVGIVFSCKVVTPRQYIEEISVVDLDKRIKGILESPEEGKGHQLLLDCNRYYDELFTIQKYIDENSPRGMELYAQVNQTGGPQFLTVEPDIENLKKVFQWKSDEPEEYDLLIVAIKRIWRNLTVTINGGEL